MNNQSISVLTYNIFLNKAYDETGRIVEKYRPGIVCLQECSPSIAQEKIGHLTLAIKAKNGSNGMALYYNKKKFELKSVSSYELPKSLYEMRDPRQRIRQQVISLLHRSNKQTFYVSNIHLVHLVVPNSSRRKQLRVAINNLSTVAQNSPRILMGDLNYPLFQNRIETIYKEQGFVEVGRKSTYKSHKLGLLSGKFDRILMSKEHWEEIEYTVLPFGSSDHAPILSTLKMR